MKLNEMRVLQALKDGLCKSAKGKGLLLTEKDFGSKRWNKSEKRVFYLFDKRNNLFDIPNHKTELGTGVEAVRSSAAMVYNLLGEKEFILDHKVYSGAKFEKTFPAIIDEPGNSHEAHLDAVFHSSDNTEMYAVEAKLLEWKDSPKNLAKAYLDKDMYLDSNKERQVFIDFFHSLVHQEEDKEGRYKHKTKTYDAIQMTIHTLALYNHFSQYPTSTVKKLTLQNIVWKYDCDEYETEEKEAFDYMQNANEQFAPLFKKLGIDFSIQYSTFQDFKKRIDFTNAQKRFDYLKRYEIRTGKEFTKPI